MRIFITILLACCTTYLSAQREVIMSQYMYNKYNINPAFAGSHESLSVFASFRKQWLGFDNSPSGGLATVHSPLKKENMALGAQFYTEKFGVTDNSGFNISYAYRLHLSNNAKLSFGLSGGMYFQNNNWNSVVLVDTDDETFSQNEQLNAPWLGFGAAVYHKKYFAGFSIPSLIYTDRYNTGENKLDFEKIDYLIAGGYFYNVNNDITLHPATLIRINADQTTFADISVTGIYREAFLIGCTYRTTNEIVALLGYQITNQFRLTYSMDYNINPIATHNNGTHEIGIQFDFGYKIDTPSPKFF